MPMGIYVIIVLLAMYLMYAAYDFVKYRYILSKIPGLQIAPIRGNAYQLNARNPAAFFRQLLSNCGRFPDGIFRMFLAPLATIPVVCIYKAEDAETMLKSQTNITKGYGYVYFIPWLGTGLLTSTGSKWSHRRKMLTSTFHFRILDDFISVFNEQSAILVEKLDKHAADSNVFDVFHYFTLCTIDTICETAMGKKINAQGNGNNEYVNAVTRMTGTIVERFWTPSHWNDYAYAMTDASKEYKRCLKTIHEFTKSVIMERDAERKTRRNNNNYNDDSAEMSCGDKKGKKLAFLELLLNMKDEDSTFTFADIQEEVDTFMFGGHDTTSVAASWALYLLGAHPDIQQRVFDELDEVFEENEECTTAKLDKLTYLGCVMKETLRLFPSAPFITREIVEECTIHGYTIPKGTELILVIYHMHRDPEYFPDPEKFNSDRFLPENQNNIKRHAFSYVPFSAGLRNCIGQRFAALELKVMLSSILRRFQIESVDPLDKIDLHAQIILRPGNGINIKLSRR